MAVVFNKDLWCWYIITLKLKETVEAGIQYSQCPKIQQNHKQEQHPSDPPKIVNEGETGFAGAGPKSPESDWIISIREKLEQAVQDDTTCSWAKLSIYRVPEYLREGDEKAYIPQTVSLGPYHRGIQRLRKMDRHKWRSVQHILKRTNQDIKLYLDSIRELEAKARACYEGPINLSSNEFVETMVIDGCFVLELFRGAVEGFKQLGYSRKDPIFATRGSMHSLQRDMIMLENQIPLFVLDRLLGLQFGQPDQKGRVARLAVRFFDPLMPTDEPLTKRDMHRSWEWSMIGKTSLTAFDPFGDLGSFHCLDVFRRSLLHTGPEPDLRIWIKRWCHSNRVADKRKQQLVHCVTELRESGIKFKLRKTDRFWDIKFKNGVLEIPRLFIHDGTKSLFLNLMAFEQCHIDCNNDITSYVVFLDNLIDSPEDVKYLHYHGIIEHWLGSDAEVADLFNRLCQEVAFDTNDNYLSRVSDQVNRYYDYRWNAWRASLKHNYFNNPWAIISVVAAMVLLVFTFAQTFYGVYGYYNP